MKFKITAILLPLLFLQVSAEEIVLYGPKSKNGFIANGRSLVQSSETGVVNVRFNDKWSALILKESNLPEDAFGKLNFTAEYRILSPDDAKKPIFAGFRFLNEIDEGIKSKSRKELKHVSSWTALSFEEEIPTELRKVGMIFINTGKAELEIRNAKLFISGVTPTSAAIRGVNFKFRDPPCSHAAQPAPDRAEIEIFKSVPNGFDQTFWEKLPEYVLRSASFDKKQPEKDDHKAFFKMASDGRYLYVFCRAWDDKLNFNGENIYSSDCFEFFLHPGGTVKKTTLRPEQYTISMSSNGESVSRNCEGIARKQGEHSWEAIMKIPLFTDDRTITPFNGLELTFNVIYQDADSVPQEHYLTYSARDRGNMSWNTPSAFIPLTFRAAFQTKFKPYLLPSSNACCVLAKHPGRINLSDNTPVIDGVGFWTHPGAKLSIRDNAYTLKFPASGRPEQTILMVPGFSVLPGETIDCEYEARIDKGTMPAWGMGFFSFSNWTGSSTGATGVFNSSWKKFKMSFIIRKSLINNMRSGFFFLGNWNKWTPDGRTVQIRSIKITRRLPVDFDAAIRMPSMYADFPDDAEPDILTFEFDSPMNRATVVSCTIVEYFTGKPVLSMKKKHTVKAGKSKMTWDVSALKRGFFNAILDVQTGSGAFLAHRELYVTKSLRTGVVNHCAGTWGNSWQFSPRRYGEIAKMLKSIGIGTYYISDWNMVDANLSELEFNPDLEFAKSLKENGMTVCSVLYRYNPKRGELLQTDDFLKLAEAQFRYSGNYVDYWNFCNEPNLGGGWSPFPNAAEWGLMYRAFHSAAKRLQPHAKVVFGNINGIPVGFLNEAWKENGAAFADGILGVHLYNIDVNGNAFQEILKNRLEYEKMYPGWELWDTESGLVYHTYKKLLELQTKRLPLQMCAGVPRHFFYHTGDLLHPYGDSTPLIPAEAFKNRFLHGLIPVGRATFRSIHLYAFQRADGSSAAVFWNTRPESVSLDIPALAGARHFDQYGNALDPIPKNGKIDFPDRFVHYAENFDLSAIRRSAKFKPAFQSTRKTPEFKKGNKFVYVLPDPLTLNTKMNIPAGITRKLSLMFRNDGPKEVRIAPKLSLPDGISVPPIPHFLLPPHKSKITTMEIRSGADFKQGVLLIGGKVEGGEDLIPAAITLDRGSAVAVAGNTRSLTVKNNTENALEMELTMQNKSLVFKPERIQIKNLAPGENRSIPLSVFPKGKGTSTQMGISPTSFYTMRWNIGKKDFSAPGTAFFFKAFPFENKDRIPPFRVKSGTFSAEYTIFKVKDGIRILASASDSTPDQQGKAGALRSGGDCFVAALQDQSGKYREFGFAPLADGFTSYEWNGTFGLENTKDASACVNAIRRTKDKIFYDVIIPFSGKIPGAAFSLLFIDRAGANRNSVIEVGGGILKRSSTLMGSFID